MTKKINQSFKKSPMNWPGNKYKLLNQLYQFFPLKINNFIDLFCGGLDVSINTQANNKYANDINQNIINIYKAFQKYSEEEIFNYINLRIKEFKLTRFNIEGYLQYRQLYNSQQQYSTPLDLFVLTRFSYNNKLSFNLENEYNGSFGYNHSDFNLTQRANTKILYKNIQNIHFSSINFRNFDLSTFTDSNDFLYVDPPYLISDAQYNNGSRKNNNKWQLKDDIDLYNFLDNATKIGIKWALSNLISHKGQENIILIQWAEQYNIHDIYSNYSHVSHNQKKINEPTIEVLVTNY